MTASPFTTETVARRRLRIGRWNWDNRATATPLLIFNGIGMNMEVMDPIVSELAGRPILMFDMPGIGRSPEPLVPYTPCMAAAWGAELLKREGIAEVDVLGFSWGGAIAQQFAIEHAQRLRKLVLAGIGPGFPAIPGKPSILAHLADPLHFGDLLAGGLFAALSPLDRAVLTPQFNKRLILPGSRGYLYQLMALAGWTSTPFLPFLAKPVLIMMGEKDPIVPLVNGRMLKALIPGARLATFKDGGHLFMFSQQARFVSLLRDFLQTRKQEQRRAA